VGARRGGHRARRRRSRADFRERAPAVRLGRSDARVAGARVDAGRPRALDGRALCERGRGDDPARVSDAAARRVLAGQAADAARRADASLRVLLRGLRAEPAGAPPARRSAAAVAVSVRPARRGRRRTGRAGVIAEGGHELPGADGVGALHVQANPQDHGQLPQARKGSTSASPTTTTPSAGTAAPSSSSRVPRPATKGRTRSPPQSRNTIGARPPSR